MYVHVKDVTVYVTVRGVDRVEIEYGRESGEPEQGRGDGEAKRGGRGLLLLDKAGGQSEMAEVNVAPLVSTFQERDTESQKKDDESETLYNDYQPSPKELGPQDIQGFDVWA